MNLRLMLFVFLICSQATGQELVPVPQSGHTNTIRSADISPDKTQIATGGEDGTILVSNYPSGEITSRLTVSKANPDDRGSSTREQSISVIKLAFSPDGNYLAAATWTNKELITTIWDIKREALLGSFPSDFLIWKKTGVILVIVAREKIILWTPVAGFITVAALARKSQGNRRNVNAEASKIIFEDDPSENVENEIITSNFSVFDLESYQFYSFQIKGNFRLQYIQSDTGHAILLNEDKTIQIVDLVEGKVIGSVALKLNADDKDARWLSAINSNRMVVAVRTPIPPTDAVHAGSGTLQYLVVTDAKSGREIARFQGEVKGTDSQTLIVIQPTDGDAYVLNVISLSKTSLYSRINWFLIANSGLIISTTEPRSDEAVLLKQRSPEEAVVFDSVLETIVSIRTSTGFTSESLAAFPSGNEIAISAVKRLGTGESEVLTLNLDTSSLTFLTTGVSTMDRMRFKDARTIELRSYYPDSGVNVLDDNFVFLKSVDILNGRSSEQDFKSYRAKHKGFFSAYNRMEMVRPNGRVLTFEKLPPMPDRALYLFGRPKPNPPSAMIQRTVVSEKSNTVIASVRYQGTGGAYWGGVSFWNATSGKYIGSCNEDFANISSLIVSPDGKRVIALERYSHVAKIIDVQTRNVVGEFSGHDDGIAGGVTFDNWSKLLTYSQGYLGVKDVIIWDISSRQRIATLTGHTGHVTSAVALPKYRAVVTGSEDGTLRFWSTENYSLLATMYMDRSLNWLVITPDGRYDSNRPDGPGLIRWRFATNLQKTFPISVFMRDYFEPRLLAKALGRSIPALPALKPITKVNTDLPVTEIVDVSPSTDPSLVTITVRIHNERLGMDTEKRTNDVHIMRDGRVISHAEGVVVNSRGSSTIKFEAQLPSASGLAAKFSAYAFNSDRIKGETSRVFEYMIPHTQPQRAPRAYILTVGINKFENPSLRLNFAVDDAMSMKHVLERIKNYEVHSLLLVSDFSFATKGNFLDATKENIRLALRDLSSQSSSSSARIGSSGDSTSFQKATPDDIVIITFASHGYVDSTGEFFILPSDTGGADPAANSSLSRFISSTELATWLREIDAAQIYLIIDACHSAGSVGKNFKPGPMGDRTLGQVAYDKGMVLLAATQVSAVALESSRVRAGLLSYSLVHDAFRTISASGYVEADMNEDGKLSINEWMKYAAKRVPMLYDEILKNRIRIYNQRLKSSRSWIKIRKLEIQQPSIFDFSGELQQLLAPTIF